MKDWGHQSRIRVEIPSCRAGASGAEAPHKGLYFDSFQPGGKCEKTGLRGVHPNMLGGWFDFGGMAQFTNFEVVE